MALPDRPFWETKALGEMSSDEWESLCDRCGRCCLVVLADDEHDPSESKSDEFFETSVCCQLFDPVMRRCTRYAERRMLVPDCVKVTPQNAPALQWMPESCAYRRLADGRGLAAWHPLVSGSAETVVDAGIAVDAELIPETNIHTDELWRYVTRPRGRD